MSLVLVVLQCMQSDPENVVNVLWIRLDLSISVKRQGLHKWQSLQMCSPYRDIHTGTSSYKNNVNKLTTEHDAQNNLI